MRKIHWLQLTTEDFAGLDPEKTVAVLPIASLNSPSPNRARLAPDSALSMVSSSVSTRG